MDFIIGLLIDNSEVIAGAIGGLVVLGFGKLKDFIAKKAADPEKDLYDVVHKIIQDLEAKKGE